MTENAIDQDIQRLASNLRLGNKITTLYKEIPFNDRGAFVRDLLQKMFDSRIAERSTRNIQLAKFPEVKTLEGYELDHLELPKNFTMEWFTQGHFIDEKQNLILLGNPGTGKTHLATALGVEACRRGHRVAFWRVAALVNSLAEAYQDSALGPIKRKVAASDLLIFDEWGYVPTNVNGTRLLFDIINECYERKSIILTTNLPLVEWTKIFGDERLLVAMMDRLVHHGLIIKHRGGSYRLEHSLMQI